MGRPPVRLNSNTRGTGLAELPEPRALYLEPAALRKLAEVRRGIGFVTRDERVLRTSGLTSEEAVLEVDRMIWDGILRP